MSRQQLVSILRNDTTYSGSVVSSTNNSADTHDGPRQSHFSAFYLSGDPITPTPRDRHLARSLIKSAETLSLQRLKLSSCEFPSLDALRKVKFVFIRFAIADERFLAGCVKSYEITDFKGTRLFYAKEIEGTGEQNSWGDFIDKIFCILALDGTELIRMEGGTHVARQSSARDKTGEFLSCFRGTAYVGDIIEKLQNCPKRSYLLITDQKQKTVAQVRRDLNLDRKCCLRRLCSKGGLIGSKKDSFDESTVFKILMPDTLDKMGAMGNLTQLYSEIPSNLNKNRFGVELPDPLCLQEKTLILAAAFMLYRPV